MAEKRGHLEKLINPFNTAGLLEVFMPKLNGWYRVTSREFRSFDGKRRISEPTEVVRGKLEVEMRSYDYFGPVFLWGTNMELVEPTNEGKLVESPYYVEMMKASGSRR